MRVITGLAKGHKLISLEGNETRPTTDRVKESMFSIIHQHIEGSIVLDLFAGSGALGIEALSRGAMLCDFVDQSRNVANIIESNLKKTHLEGYKIHIRNAKDYLLYCEKKYDLVLLDPPYKKGLCELSMELISEYNLLNDGAIIVCESSASEELKSPFNMIKQSKYGNIMISVFENR